MLFSVTIRIVSLWKTWLDSQRRRPYQADMAGETNLIHDRRAEIASERERLQAEIDRLAKEEAELDVAERVIRNLEARSAFGDAHKEIEAMASGQLGKKPTDIPTVPEMIVKVFEQTGAPDGLSPKEITEYIRMTWWPGASAAEVSPIAWRMAKRGQLQKEGSIYRLPKVTATASDLF